MGHLDSFRSLPAIGGDSTGLSPMAKKLRCTQGLQVAVLNSPEGFAAQLQPGPAAVTQQLEPGQTYDAVLLFVHDADELRRLGPPAIRAVKPNALLWITCPKGGKTRGATDLPATPWWMQSDVLGDITSERGFKPVAFVAVDEHWTALRFKRA